MSTNEKCPLHKSLDDSYTRLNDDLSDLKKDIKDDHKIMWDDIKSKVSTRLFMWILGFIILFILALAGTQTKILYDFYKIETKYEKVDK